MAKNRFAAAAGSWEPTEGGNQPKGKKREKGTQKVCAQPPLLLRRRLSGVATLAGRH